MQILSRLCFVLIFCSVLELHERGFQYFLGFVLMDSVTCFNSYLLWSFKQVFKVVGLFLLLGFGLKVLKFRFLYDSGGKTGALRNGICAGKGFDVKCRSKISSSKCGSLIDVRNSSPPVLDKLEKTELLNSDGDRCYEATNVYSEECNNDDGDSEGCDDESLHYDEDTEFDVLALRKLIKAERGRANSALLELEKERMSSATAVEESMAMILRLQNEKSLIEMESRQYRRLAEEKLLYDQKVLKSLQWTVSRHESNRALLDDQLRLCQQKLGICMESDDMDQYKEVGETFSYSTANFEEALDHSLFSSLDLDLKRASF